MKVKCLCLFLVALLGSLFLCACQEKTNQSSGAGEPNHNNVQNESQNEEEPNHNHAQNGPQNEEEPNGDIVLDASIVEKITVAYEKLHNRKLSVPFDCYGIFGEVYVLIFHGGDAAITYETVDNVTYRFPVVESFDVYYEGEFYSLQEAFDNGLVSHEDLLTIRENHEGK